MKWFKSKSIHWKSKPVAYTLPPTSVVFSELMISMSLVGTYSENGKIIGVYPYCLNSASDLYIPLLV